MPNTTGSYPMPYPNSSAVPDVPGDVLALAQEVDDTLTTEITRIDADIAALPLPGLVPIVPGSVSGSGVSVDATGLVTFSSATTITIDNCWTSDFRNYRIFIESTGTAANLTCVLRTTGGSDVTTANYDRTELLARNGTVSSSTNVAGSSWTVVGISNTLMQADMDISAPGVAVPTTCITRGGIHANPAVSSTSNGFVQNYLTHRLSTAYGGIKFTYSNAQSGTVRVYGYN